MKVTAKILIVDDEPVLLKAAELVLKKAGYDPSGALSGSEALQMTLDLKPDLVLLDVNLPDIDGFEVCRRIKADPGLVGTYIILLSGKQTASEDQAAGLDTGADGYITRPVSNQELLARVESMLRIQSAEKALRINEQRFRTIYERLPLGYQSLDADGYFLDVNQAWLEILGYERADVIGKWFGDFLIPEQADLFRQRFPVFKKLGSIHSEFEMIRKDGKRIFVTFDGQIGYDEQMQFKQTHCVLTDITERKLLEIELQQTLEELKRSNTELEQFAYIASHDLQEPLRMVSSYLTLLQRRYQGKLDQNADEFIAFAVDGAERAQRLINDLLTYSRVGRHGQPFTPTACETVLDHALNNLQLAIADQQAEVTHDPLPVVNADETQLVQLFQNLVANAIKFHGEEKPHVHISAVKRENEWVFSVHDNGIGINPKDAERIFIIFQRLNERSRYPGTGIGLAVCKKIVQRHGGQIWVEATPGSGSTFYFTLPIKRTESL